MAKRRGEFALALNCLTEQFARLKLPGLVRLCEGLENTSLALFGDHSTHPIPLHEANTLNRQLEILMQSVKMAQPRQQGARRDEASSEESEAASEWVKPREVWVIAEREHPWVAGLIEQFSFFGFRMSRFAWEDSPAPAESPLVILFIPPAAGYEGRQIERVARKIAKSRG